MSMRPVPARTLGTPPASEPEGRCIVPLRILPTETTTDNDLPPDLANDAQATNAAEVEAEPPSTMEEAEIRMLARAMRPLSAAARVSLSTALCGFALAAIITGGQHAPTPATSMPRVVPRMALTNRVERPDYIGDIVTGIEVCFDGTNGAAGYFVRFQRDDKNHLLHGE